MDLRDFFIENNKAAIAFSGGTDSSLLLYSAVKASADVRAYCIKNDFQPVFELEDAKAIAEFAGAVLKIIETDLLSDDLITSNPENRCYYCKKKLFSEIIKAAASDGYDLILDGSNASDDPADRPGMKALSEMNIRSPLRECGLTKDDVRRLSKEAGLPTWNKPSYACLATRIPAGKPITRDNLEKTEKAESLLFEKGFRDFRIRMPEQDTALIQLKADQFDIFDEKREEILSELNKYYDKIIKDSEAR